MNLDPRMTQDKVGGDPGPGMEVDNIETNVTESGDQASHDLATWSGLAVQVKEQINFKHTSFLNAKCLCK